MKRCAFRLLVFLLLGVIINVAVAWGLSVALWEPAIIHDGMNVGSREVFSPSFHAHPGWPARALTIASHLTESSYSCPYYLRAGKYSFAYRPLWPGFAINTIFYAAILWALFTVPGMIKRRRRIKRGVCVRCAYPVGTSSAVCSECGTPVQSRSAVHGAAAPCNPC
jgi:hypothetical protein